MLASWYGHAIENASLYMYQLKVSNHDIIFKKNNGAVEPITQYIALNVHILQT